MASNDMSAYREQILVNAKVIICPLAKTHQSPASLTNRSLETSETSATLTNMTSVPGDIQVVIHGKEKQYKAAVMVGVTPAIEGEAQPTPDMAMKRLLHATCELLDTYMPKLLAHQRVIHGANGVFDEDFISPDLLRSKGN